jgi:membrane-associated protease RseP (regulator of RpoE activity)
MQSQAHPWKGWLVTALGGLLAAAVLLGALVPSFAAPAPEPPKKEEPKKEEPKKPAEPEIPFPIPDIDKLFPPGAIDPDQLKEIQKMMEEIRKQMGQMQRVPGVFPGALPGRLRAIPLNRVGRDTNLESRMGASLQSPNATLIEQLSLPDRQGLVLNEVRPESAAAKAGLKEHDILLELDGKPVSSDMSEFQKLLKEFKPDSTVDVVVLRKGKKETIKGLKLPEAKEEPNPFRGIQQRFQIFPGGNIPAPNILPPAGGAPGGAQVQNTNTTMTRTADGSFITSQEQNGVKLTVSGKMENDKANVTEIEVHDGKEAKQYKSIDDVPEAHRDAVRNLIQMSEGKGNRSRLR